MENVHSLSVGHNLVYSIVSSMHTIVNTFLTYYMIRLLNIILADLQNFIEQLILYTVENGMICFYLFNTNFFLKI